MQSFIRRQSMIIIKRNYATFLFSVHIADTLSRTRRNIIVDNNHNNQQPNNNNQRKQLHIVELKLHHKELTGFQCLMQLAYFTQGL